MTVEIEQKRVQAQQILSDWIASCTRNGTLSRNSVAVGIVVLDHLLVKGIVNPRDVISSGGEIVGSRSGLHQVLNKHGVDEPRKYLKEVTTRQAHPDGRRLFESFSYGEFFSGLDTVGREAILLDLIKTLKVKVDTWLSRQKLQVSFDQQFAPTQWVKSILEQAKGKSGGVVEQHLVGAKLQKRHSTDAIDNYPGHAADVQTRRAGDFIIGNTVYHVTVSPSHSLIGKCRENIAVGLHPIILVPNDQVIRAKSFAEYEELDKRLTVVAIEDFVALNIIEMANEEHLSPYEMLLQIIRLYNQRVEVVETDMSLQFDL